MTLAKMEFILQHTLVETSAGVCDCGLRDSQPDHSVGPLLRSPQTLLHWAMEVGHGISHRCGTPTQRMTERDGWGQTTVSIRERPSFLFDREWTLSSLLILSAVRVYLECQPSQGAWRRSGCLCESWPAALSSPPAASETQTHTHTHESICAMMVSEGFDCKEVKHMK